MKERAFRTSIEIEKYSVVKQLIAKKGLSLKRYINGLIANAILESRDEEFIKKYFKE